MDVIESQAQTESPQFAENRERISALVKELKGRLLSVREGGGPERVELHRSRGKMLVRDRIEGLLDRDSPFLELSPLAAWGMYDDEVNSAGIVTGIGVVHGREAVLPRSSKGSCASRPMGSASRQRRLGESSRRPIGRQALTVRSS